MTDPNYTFEELRECLKIPSVNLLIAAVIDGTLVPSFFIKQGKYVTRQVRIGALSDGPGMVFVPVLDGGQFALDVCEGIFYLIGPRATGARDCDFFLFSSTAREHKEGDVCFALYEKVGMRDLLKDGFFMSDEVLRFCAIRSSDLEVKPTTALEPKSIQATLAYQSSEAIVQRSSKKRPETVAFEESVMNFMTVVWNEYMMNRARNKDLKEPTKGDMHQSVLNKLNDEKIDGRNRKPTVQMVCDAAKPWKKPRAQNMDVSPSLESKKRHPFKGTV